MKSNFLANFYNGGIFHVYNRTNNKELLFKTDENRLYFLKQYAKYLQPFLDTFCWCLLPNHFHFLVRIKTTEEIKNYLNNQPTEKLKPIERRYINDNAIAELLLEFEWKRFLISYSMAFNKQQQRKGNLFHRPFKRLEINKEIHFTQAIVYIHANAMRHKLCKDFDSYEWSSWHSMLSKHPTQLCRKEVLEWFGGLQPFKDAHKKMSEYYYNNDVAIEDVCDR
jgi:putative transposase